MTARRMISVGDSVGSCSSFRNLTFERRTLALLPPSLFTSLVFAFLFLSWRALERFTRLCKSTSYDLPGPADADDFFSLFVLLPSIVSATIQIAIQGAVTAGGFGTATWSRENGDPTNFVLAKVKEDGDSGPLTSAPVRVPNSDNTSGFLTIGFNRAGIFHLIAYDPATNSDPNNPQNLLAQSQKFGVDPPVGLSSALTLLATTTSQIAGASSSMSSALSSASTDSSMYQDTNNGGSRHKGQNGTSTHMSGANSEAIDNKVPIIVGSVVGGVFAVAVIATLCYIFIYRPRHRRTDTFRRDLMVQSPGHIASLWSRFVKRDPQDSYDRSLSPDVEKSTPPPYYAQGFGGPMRTPLRTPLSATFSTRKGPRFPSFTTTATTTDISNIYFTPFTERQMELEGRIHELQAKLINVQRFRESIVGSVVSADTDNLKVVKLQGQILVLKSLKESAWAMGMTDEVPAAYVDCLRSLDESRDLSG